MCIRDSFRLLAVKDEWFSDDLRKIDDENVYRKMQGHWIIEMSETVSYTHLDVYKRQVAILLNAAIHYKRTSKRRFALWTQKSLAHLSQPVSYTHLDVYKRQHMPLPLSVFEVSQRVNPVR